MKRVAVAAGVSLALVAGFGAVAQATPVTGTSKVQANGSSGPLALFDQTPTLITDVAKSFGYSEVIIGSGSTSSSSSVITCPNTADNALPFVTDVGGELLSPATFQATADYIPLSGAKTVTSPNLTLSGMGAGLLGASGVKSTGGRFSMGVACTKNGNQTVAAFFRDITVKASAPKDGSYTVAATSYVFTKPTTSVTRLTANINHTNPTYGAFHTGDTVNAVVADAVVPDGYTLTYQWKANGSTIANATGSSYITTTNDAGKTFTVDAIYTKGSDVQTVTSNATASLEGDAVISGDVSVSATTTGATNGQLSLSVPSPMSASLTGPTLVSGYSTTTGDLGQVSVVDGRIVTLDGWDLKMDTKTVGGTTSFVNQADPTIKIAATQLGIAPRIVGSPGNTNAVKGTDQVAGATVFPVTLASSAKVTTPGDSNTSYVGTTNVNATLTLVAPQWKPAGTYAATFTLTVVSR